MLTNVLGAYLDGVKEREFDFPFLTLLHASGFYDVHFTHGHAEFGKDFIAKFNEDGQIIQFSFQSKAGDVSQSDWRDGIMGQMLESVIIGLSHPNFDKNIPHQCILVLTGKLIGNAPIAFQAFNNTVEHTYGKRRAGVWDRETLLTKLEKWGLGSVYKATASGFTSYGNFYKLYGEALEGRISCREIEEHSRQWLDESVDSGKRLLCSAIEAEVFASQCEVKGMLYEAFCCRVSSIRSIMYQLYAPENEPNVPWLLDAYTQAVAALRDTCLAYVADIQNIWERAGRELSSVMPGPNSMLIYLVHCARTMEMASVSTFLVTEKAEKERITSFLVDFVAKEPGCAHVPSDYYAVSLVLPVLSLCHDGHRDLATELVRNATVWLCDRYEKGGGLADISTDAHSEISTLFGYPFDFIKSQPRRSSFAAAVICDLAVYIADKTLYADVINDMKAVNIIHEYWQVPDTKSLFSLEGENIVQYPRLEYGDVLLPFDGFAFADHIKCEQRSFAVGKHTGPMGLFLMMLLLRDRYFPTLWPSAAG